VIARALPSGRAVTPIGLDLGTRTIKAVQLRRRGGVMEVCASAQFGRRGGIDTPVDDREIARIEGVLYRRGFVGSRVVIAASRAGLFSAEVDTPPRGRNVPIDMIVRAELARAQRVEAESFEQAYWDLPSAGRRQGGGVMAVGLDRGPLVQTIDRFEDAGLTVTAVDLASLALARAASASNGGATPPFLVVVDLGFSALSITVLHDGTVVYQREAPAGAMERLERRVAERVGVEPEFAEHLLESLGSDDDRDDGVSALVRGLVAEHASNCTDGIRESIGYAAHRYRTDPVASVVACGGGAELVFSGVRGADVLGAPVQVLRPSALASVEGDARAQDHPAFMLATALAARSDRGAA